MHTKEVEYVKGKHIIRVGYKFFPHPPLIPEKVTWEFLVKKIEQTEGDVQQPWTFKVLGNLLIKMKEPIEQIMWKEKQAFPRIIQIGAKSFRTEFLLYISNVSFNLYGVNMERLFIAETKRKFGAYRRKIIFSALSITVEMDGKKKNIWKHHK